MISSSKEIFEESAPEYQDALERSGFSHKLDYDDSTNNERKARNRRQKVIWFNPPYSKSVSTNVGKEFLKLIDKHFPDHNKFSKIFNRSVVKVGYSCLPNMKSKINQHNKRILATSPIPIDEESDRTCSCPRITDCPLENKCLDKEILYSAEVTSDIRGYEKKTYKGICATTFKERLRNHTKAFNHDKYKTDSELSKEVWAIKEKGGTFKVTWKKEANHPAYRPEIGRCRLCEHEKLVIALHDEKNFLNKRNEIVSRCRHRWKFKLENLIF